MIYWLVTMPGIVEFLQSIKLPGGVTLFSAFRLLTFVEFRALLAAGLSFALVVTLGPRFIRFLRSLKIGDAGISDAELLRAHTASKADTPTMGGALVASAILFSFVLLADIQQGYVTMGIMVLLWMACLGGADDWLKLTAARRKTGSRQGLYAWEKLVFQIGIAVLVGVFAVWGAEPDDMQRVLNIPLQKTYETPSFEPAQGLIFLSTGLFVVLSILMIGGLSNAVNITDGMDGLASGLTVAVSLGLIVLALIAGNEEIARRTLLVPHVPVADELAVLAGAMLGACLGFLWWNCSPAQVFMGDTGSLCLGGLIGYIALIIRQEFVVLVMCGVFLAEIGSVVLQVGYFKMTKGRRIFRCAPYHHHLHLGGWNEQQVVTRLWIVGALLAIVGIALLKLR